VSEDLPPVTAFEARLRLRAQPFVASHPVAVDSVIPADVPLPVAAAFLLFVDPLRGHEAVGRQAI
jgi:hypothetical protein